MAYSLKRANGNFHPFFRIGHHLRNHGFILSEEGWLLSPAYDINSVETASGLKLNISDNDNSLDLDLAMEVHKFFRLTEDKANEIIKSVTNSVKNWKNVATKYGISRAEQELKALAFRISRDFGKP